VPKAGCATRPRARIVDQAVKRYNVNEMRHDARNRARQQRLRIGEGEDAVIEQ
jgi:hypothetical protein